jgi:hypothetical protein
MREEEMMPPKTLAYIQSQVKAPKGQFNAFGKYKYRKAEDIMEAVKPIINPLGYWLTVTDEIIFIGNRFYVKATAILSNGINTYITNAFAREEEQKKGMDGSQITGASSSYARKYALQGLFSLDDNADADSYPNQLNDAKDVSYNPVGNEWADTIQGCSTMAELMDLYKAYKEQVDASPKLKKLFADQKTKVK